MTIEDWRIKLVKRLKGFKVEKLKGFKVERF